MRVRDLVLLLGSLMILVGVLLSIPYVKWRLSLKRDKVPIILDLRALRVTASAWGMDPLKLLAELNSEVPISGVGVHLATLDELQAQGVITYMEGWEILRYQPPWGYRAFGYEPDVNLKATYVYLRDKSIKSALLRNLRMLLGDERVKLVSGPTDDVIEILSSRELLSRLPIMLSPADAKLISWLKRRGSLNFTALRVPDFGAPDKICAVLKEAKVRLSTKPMLIFSGTSVLGYPHELNETAKCLKELGAPIGLVEVYSPKARQKGALQVAGSVPNGVVKVISVSLLAHKSTHAIAEAIELGVKERSISAVYLSPGVPDISLPSEGYRELLELLRAIRGSITSKPPIALNAAEIPIRGVSRWAYLSLLTGLLILALWLTLERGMLEWTLIAISALSLMSSVVFRSPLKDFLISLTSSVTSSLILVEVAYRIRGLRAYLKVLTLGMSILALGILNGLAFHMALGAEPIKLLGLDPLRGVKLLLLLPPLVTIALATYRERLSEESVRYSHIFIAISIVALVALYLLRSGNVNLTFGFEGYIRSLLREVLGVRPRFKEFAFGYPLLGLWSVSVERDWRGTAVLTLGAAAVGLASVMDSFAHLHTSPDISLLRSVLACLIGLSLGVIITVTWTLLRKRG